MRINRQDLFIQIAQLFSKRSTCGRLNVGCIIVKDNRIISSGYNGPLSTERLGDKCKCDLKVPCEKSIHAEANSISFAAKYGIALEGAILYSTHSPCIKCAELIVQSGIKQVVFKESFRDDTGILFLRKNNIHTLNYGEK